MRRLEVLCVRGDGTLRTAPDCRCNHVPVARVWWPDSRLELFPAGDHRVIEGLAHAGEALVASMPGWISSTAACASPRIRRPQRAIQALLSYAQQRVVHCDRHEHAGVGNGRVTRYDRAVLVMRSMRGVVWRQMVSVMMSA